MILGFGRPCMIFLAADHLMYVRDAMLDDVVGVEQIAVLHASGGLFFGGGDAGPEVTGDQATGGDVAGDVDEPELVQQGGGVVPGRSVEPEVVALEQDDAMGGRDGDVVGDGVLDGVVEAGRVDGGRLRRERFAQSSHEAYEGVGVEGEGGAASGVRVHGVRHGRQLRPGQMVPVHGHEGGDGSGRHGGEVLRLERIDSG